MEYADGLAVQRAFPTRHVHLRFLRRGVLEVPLPGLAQKRTKWFQMFVQRWLLRGQSVNGEANNEQKDSWENFHKSCVSNNPFHRFCKAEIGAGTHCYMESRRGVATHLPFIPALILSIHPVVAAF